MTSAHFEISAKRLAAYLVRQGGSPAVVASVTGVPHNFAARLARERAVRPAIRGSLAERIWSRETGVLQATLFGMCLRFVLKRYGERSEPERFVAAYRLFAVLREGVFGASHGWFSPDEALVVAREADASWLTANACRCCQGVFWLERSRRRYRCPLCRSSRWFDAAPGGPR
jgi:hypothetical protein